jgi:hypothetical protein
VLIPCSLSTPATTLPALQTTSITSVADAPSGSMASSDRMAPSSVAAPRPAVGTEDFKRKLEEECEAKQRGLEEASRPEPTLVTVKDAVARFLNSNRNENLADSTLDKLTTIFEKGSWRGPLLAGSLTSLRSRLPIWKAFVIMRWSGLRLGML